MAALCCIESKLKTHDDYVPEFILDCFTNNTIYTAGAIGDLKELELTLQYTSGESLSAEDCGIDGLMGGDISDSPSESPSDCSISDPSTLPDNLEIFFNLWLYAHGGDSWLDKLIGTNMTEMDEGWYFLYDKALHTNGIEYEITDLYGAGVNANSQMNIKIYFEAIGCNYFKLHIYFYLIADLDDIITGLSLDNHSKLLKNYLDIAVNELENVAESVYNVEKKIKSLVYVIDGDEETYFEHEFPVSFRFYDKDLYNGVSPIVTTFDLDRAIGTVNDLSIFEQTHCVITFTSATVVPVNVTAWLIRTDAFDNIKKFAELPAIYGTDNYDYSFANILTNAGAVQLHNHIYTPSELTITAGVSTIAEFYIDASDIDCNAKYRIIGVAYCEDMGSTGWVAQTSGTAEQLIGMYFVNYNTGWICGTNGKILATTDGGATWTPQVSGTAEKLNTIDGVDILGNYHVYCGGEKGKFLATDTGGSSWNLTTWGDATNIYCLSVIDEDKIWICGASGTIRFFDGLFHNQVSGVIGDLYGIDFIDANTGWCCGSAGVILKTTNGGTNWNAQTSGVVSILIYIHFIDSNNGWCSGSNGVILKTTNGGTSWTQITSGTTQSLYAIKFYDETHGWACGQNGTMLFTADGGNNWYPQTSGVVGFLLNLYTTLYNNQIYAYACGDSGKIINYLYDLDREVYSSISDELEITCVPDCCNAYIENEWTDYNHNFYREDSIIACVQDRMLATANLFINGLPLPAGKDYIADCIDSWCNTLGIDSYPAGYAGQYCYRITGVKVQIAEIVEDYPNNQYNTIAIYDEQTATRDIATGLWTVPDNMTITELLTNLLCEYEFRCRYESGQLPIDVRIAAKTSPFDEFSVGILLSNYATANNFSQNWVNKNLELIWRITLDFNDAPVPFQHELINRQRLYVHDYDDFFNLPYIEYVKLIDPSTLQEMDYPCSDMDWCYVKVKALCDESSSDSCSSSCSGSESASDCCDCCDSANLISQIDTAIYSINNIGEEESYVGELEQLSADELYDVDSIFGDDCIGWFKLDLSKLTAGKLYRICGMAKRCVNNAPMLRITISGGSWGGMSEGTHIICPTSYECNFDNPNDATYEHWRWINGMNDIDLDYAWTTDMIVCNSSISDAMNSDGFFDNYAYAAPSDCHVIIDDAFAYTYVLGTITITIARTKSWASRPHP